MEINITRFFREACASDYSASCSEIGQDAGRVTWSAAIEDSDEYQLLTSDDARQAFREFIAGFGAWEDERISGFSDIELNALFIQFVSGDIREAGLDVDSPNWDEYEKGANDGRWSGRIFKGDDGEVYYYVGD